MGYETFFIAPDGTELAVITRAELEHLRGGHVDEDAADIAAADRTRAESDVRYPAEVMDAMLAGDSPIAAWRKSRGYSQAALAQRCGITQAAVSRLETAGDDHQFPEGRWITRQNIARALDIPPSALEPLWR
jgi:DNA-binding XRE family transcriptional regulator